MRSRNRQEGGFPRRPHSQSIEDGPLTRRPAPCLQLAEWVLPVPSDLTASWQTLICAVWMHAPWAEWHRHSGRHHREGTGPYVPRVCTHSPLRVGSESGVWGVSQGGHCVGAPGSPSGVAGLSGVLGIPEVTKGSLGPSSAPAARRCDVSHGLHTRGQCPLPSCVAPGVSPQRAAPLRNTPAGMGPLLSLPPLSWAGNSAGISARSCT